LITLHVFDIKGDCVLSLPPFRHKPYKRSRYVSHLVILFLGLLVYNTNNSSSDNNILNSQEHI
jgi:hypothetical protein